MRIRKNDLVEVITGRDKGKRGKVLVVLPDKGRVLVQGVNFIKRHTRPNPQKNIKGGIAEREAPMHVSNVMIVSVVTLSFSSSWQGNQCRLSIPCPCVQICFRLRLVGSFHPTK